MSELPAAHKCWAVIPAAGVGTRMESVIPKQYLKVAGKTLLEHSLNALISNDFIQSVVVALSSTDQLSSSVVALDNPRVIKTLGGSQRSDSVLAALLALDGLASPDDWVLVHDAARPCIRPSEIAMLVQQVITTGVGGILAVPIVDTVKRTAPDKRVVETISRDDLWCVQTPQMFRVGVLRDALQQACSNKRHVTDEAHAMELAGHRVQIVPGSARNLKVTVPDDLALAKFYLEQHL